jgi:hypothetical protein
MNKKYILAAVACVVGLAVAFVISSGSAKAFSVNDVASDPAAFGGIITITGIMGGVSQFDQKVFGIMDVKELQCKSQNCNKVFIPIKYEGQMPVPGDEVKATGSFVKMTEGYLFAARDVKVLRNHKIGG